MTLKHKLTEKRDNSTEKKIIPNKGVTKSHRKINTYEQLVVAPENIESPKTHEETQNLGNGIRENILMQTKYSTNQDGMYKGT